MDLLGFFRVLRRRWVLIVVLTVVGGIIGAASTQLEQHDPKAYYKASTTLFLEPGTGSAGTFRSAFTSLDQIAVLTTTGAVPDLVATKLGSTEPGRKLAEQMITTTNSVANTLEITAIAPTPGEASRLADTFADQLIANLTDRDTQRYNTQRDSESTRIDSLTTQVDQLTQQIAANPNDGVARATLNSAQNELGSTLSDFSQLTAGGPPATRLSNLERAESIPIDVSEYGARLSLGRLGQNHLTQGDGSEAGTTSLLTRSSTSTFRGPVSRGLLGALLGLLAGMGLALLMEHLDHRIRSRADAEETFALPVLAEIPRISKTQEKAFAILSFTEPMSRTAEAFRAIRSSLLFQRAGMLAAAAVPDSSDPDALFEPETNEPFVIMVTSADPREGKTTTTANLAAVFAEAGSSVLLVNCDFRRPTLHKYFGIDDEPRRVHDTMIPGVKLITNVLSDPNPNPAHVVAAQRHVVAAAAAAGRFAVILLDTAPLLSANDAVELVGSADLVVLVAKAEVSTSDDANLALDLLRRLDAPLAGVVLSGIADVPNKYYYSYANGGERSRSDRNGDGNANGNGNANSNGNGRGSSADLFAADESPDPSARPTG